MKPSELHHFRQVWLPQLEHELCAIVSQDEPATTAHYGMIRYHLGWMDEQLQPQTLPTGKRLRPLFCLLACTAVGGDPAQALPAAAALELIHNFSLIHDDIEDGDEIRHHRPTVWKLWGVPQAINVGDGVFTLAYIAMQRLAQQGIAPETTLHALQQLTQATRRLIEGQALDLSFEQRATVTVEEYLHMIHGKTAALFGGSVAIGALLGGASVQQVVALEQFGHVVGMAFQMQDDILGIWGDPARTGKAAGNDLLRRKKSLPILYALNHEQVGEAFAALLAADLRAAQLPQALALLEQADARPFAEAQLCAHYQAGITAWQQAFGSAPQPSMLLALAESLLHRRS